jgi:hypothetical protein
MPAKAVGFPDPLLGTLKPWGQQFSTVTLNIIPTTPNQTIVVLSYHKKALFTVRKYIAPIILANYNKKKILLSHLIVDRAETFFISLDIVDLLTDDKKTFIDKNFLYSLFSSSNKVDKKLMLFPS